MSLTPPAVPFSETERLCQSALDVSEKRGTVSPFQQGTFSSIIQRFLKIKMNIQPASPPKRHRINVVVTSLCRSALAAVASCPTATRRRCYRDATQNSTPACDCGVARGRVSQFGDRTACRYQSHQGQHALPFHPADGDRSNALGFHFFTGETGMGELRRGVLAFDIAGKFRRAQRF